LYGQSGGDTLSGDAGNDTIYGGSGGDLIIGGSGMDQLYGGFGADTFRFLPGDSAANSPDVIHDFQVGLDKIEFSGFAPSVGSDDLTVEVVGGDTLLKLNTDANASTFELVVKVQGITNFNATQDVFFTI
jgi:Ca2+-binding RTX toxin-like protein